MAKTIRFELEFTGWQNLRIDDDGALVRPPTAEQMAKALRDDLQRRCDDFASRGRGKLRVTLKQLP